MQIPSSHLKGHGCPKCADIENGKRKRKWTYETCRDEAKKYKTKVEFQQGSSGAFKYAYNNGIIKDFDWFEELKKPNGYWTKERCEEESRKYQTKKEFLKGCSAAHHAAVVNGWLDDYDWLIDKRIDIIKDKIDCVYVYVFEDTKTAYVGRTLIRRQKKRDKEHIFNLEADNVARYAKEHHVSVPPMTILETNLTLEEGLDREDYWRRWYEQQGYTMLNRLATGIGKGSLGAIGQGKWNRKSCYEEAKKYKSATEFLMGVHMMLHEEMDGLKIIHGLMCCGRKNGIKRLAITRQRSIRLEMSSKKVVVVHIKKHGNVAGLKSILGYITARPSLLVIGIIMIIVSRKLKNTRIEDVFKEVLWLPI